MRRGFNNAWKYDSSPVERCSVCGVFALATSISENGVTRHYCADCVPSSIEREYDRKFPAYEPPATDNEVSLARFHRLAGKSHRVVKDVENAGTTMTRREETYARLAEKMRGNKWFDEHA